jgi:hypothetical protein
MNPIISELIPQQGFEIVRDMIGAILKIEIENQKTLSNQQTPNSFQEDVRIFQERLSPIGESDEVVINVQLSSANYSGLTRKDTQGATIFFVDIYTTGKETDDKSGDIVSSSRLHKFLGLCRYIISHTEYKTLTLQPGVIAGVTVDGFNILEPSLKEDALFFRMGRLTISYKIQENQSMPLGNPLTASGTTVRLEETNLGYEYLLNN